MSVTHSFNVNVARVVKERKAVMLNNFAHWQKVNQAKDNHCFPDPEDEEGIVYVWLWNSISDFQKLWPYMTEREVDYALQSLETDGYLKTGTFNQQARDRTKWYALTPKACTLLGIDFPHFTKVSNAFHNAVKSILQGCEIHSTGLSNASDRIVPPLPDINPDVNSDGNLLENPPNSADEKTSTTGGEQTGDLSDSKQKKGNAPPVPPPPPRPVRRDPFLRNRDAETCNVPFSAWFALFDYNANREQAKSAWLDLTDEERVTAMEHTPLYVVARQEKRWRGFPNNYLIEKKFNNEIVARSDSANNTQTRRGGSDFRATQTRREPAKDYGKL